MAEREETLVAPRGSSSQQPRGSGLSVCNLGTVEEEEGGGLSNAEPPKDLLVERPLSGV